MKKDNNPQLLTIEKIIFDNQNIAHDLINFDYDEKLNIFKISVSPVTSNEVKRTFQFENISNFSYDLDKGEDLRKFPRPIVGIDYYDNPEKEFNTVINCGEIEFIFYTSELPKRIY